MLGRGILSPGKRCNFLAPNASQLASLAVIILGPYPVSSQGSATALTDRSERAEQPLRSWLGALLTGAIGP